MVADLVARWLGSDRCSAVRAATVLGLRPRTLQRRLRAEGSSFERIKDAARREAASHLLTRSDLALAQIAEILGYSEASVLSRSCCRWFGRSSAQLRSALASNGA